MLFHTLTDRPTAAKPYDLTYELRPGYLYVKVHAETINYDIARAYWNEVLVMLSRFRRDRVLVHKDIYETLALGDAFRIASEVAFEFHSVKLAICDRHATPDSIKFGETVAVNRGLNTRSFTDIEAARDWLLEGAHGEVPLIRRTVDSASEMNVM